MLFRLLITAQLLYFCLTDVYWPPSIVWHYNMLEKVNNKLPPTYRAMTPAEVAEVAQVVVEPSSTVIAKQLNSTEHLTGFQESSVEATAIAIPESVIITPSGDTITRSYDDKNYMLAREQKMEIYGGGKQYGNEVFKRRVIKMAVAPSNAPAVANEYASTTKSEAEAAANKPHEWSPYGFKSKQR